MLRVINIQQIVRRYARQWLVRCLALLLRPLLRPQAALRSVLVIEPGHLGDILLLTPALKALREQNAALRIVVMVGPWGKSLLQTNPHIDQLLTCPFPGFVRGERASFWRPYARLWSYGMLLRAGRFDAALVARDDHWWGGLLVLLAGIPQRIGLAHSLVAPTLSSPVAYDPQQHVTEQRLALVHCLTGQPPGRPASVYRPGAAAEAWAEQWWGEQHFKQAVVAIQPGSGGAAKLWLPERWAEVARELALNYAIVLTGGPVDREHIAQICFYLDRHNVAYHVVSDIGLDQLAAFFKRCVVVAGTDNGPLHLAVAQGVPTVHLFGPGDAGRFGPWGSANRQRVIREPLWCAPCGVLSACPRQTAPSECMQQITTASVVEAVQNVAQLTAGDPQR